MFLRKVPALRRPAAGLAVGGDRPAARAAARDEPVLGQGARVGVLRRAARRARGPRHADRVRRVDLGLRARDGRRRDAARALADRPARVRRRPLAARARAGARGHRRPLRRRRRRSTPRSGYALSGEVARRAARRPGQVAARASPDSHSADLDQRVEVDAGLHALAVEQVDEVLGGDVAGRARRERAAAEAADGGVEDRRAVLEAGERVGVAGVARVVQVQADGLAGLQRSRARSSRTCAGRRRRSCRPASPRPRRRPPSGARARSPRRGRRRPRTGSRTRPRA